MALEHVGDRLRMTCVLPPFSGRLARSWNHRGKQDEPCHGYPRGHKGRRERAEGLGDDDDLVARGDRAGRGVGMVARRRLWVLERKRWSDGVVAEAVQRLDGRAVHARVGAGTRD